LAKPFIMELQLMDLLIPPNNKLSLLPTRIQPNVAMMSLETHSKTSLNHAGVNLKFKL